MTILNFFFSSYLSWFAASLSIFIFTLVYLGTNSHALSLIFVDFFIFAIGFTELSKIKDKVNHHDSEIQELKASSFSCSETLQTQEISMKSSTAVACENNVNSASFEASDIQNSHSHPHDMGRHHAKTQSDDEYSDLGNLSSEVSAIYLAMQNSKLECVDEHSQDTISTDGCVEPDESDEFDDFDPYLFIKDLPDLSAVVPRFRPMLLPKQTRSCPSTTLVLDLDGMVNDSSLAKCVFWLAT